MSGTNYPDGRYKMTNPHDETGDGWTIEQISGGRLRGSWTLVGDWTAMGYTFEPVIIMTVAEYEETLKLALDKADKLQAYLDDIYDPGEAVMNDYD